MNATVADRVSLIICVFSQERWDDLRSGLTALGHQTSPPDEVIVVVDHNPDLYRRLAESAVATGTTRLVESDHPRGLSGARNCGVELATGSVVAFLDDDATPAPDWLEHLLVPFADPRVVGVGGAADPQWPGDRPSWWPEEFDWVVGCSYRGLPAGGPVRNVHGVAMAFRAGVFAAGERFSQEVGRVGTRPTGCEETELCIRVRRRWPDSLIVFEPRARVRHRVTEHRQGISYFSRRCLAEGRSKATVARLVGAGDALSTERAYVTRTLVRGVTHGLAGALTGRETAGLARASTILLGLALTGTGYTMGRLTDARSVRRETPPADLRPIQLLDLDLEGAEPPTASPASGPVRTGNEPYERARILVREGSRPVGVVDLELAEGRLAGREVAAIRERFGRERDPSQPRPAGHQDKPGGLDVTVVIATRDRPDGLRRCIDSVLATGYPGVRVVVVDNAPTSAATEDLVRDRYPAVHYVREDAPGLARAHNAGLEQVTTPVVAFTDDDVVVDEGWLRSLARRFAEDESVGCVTGLIWPAELETPAQVLIEAHGRFGKGFESRRVDLADSRPDDPLFPYATGRLGSGANMAFRTAALRAIGGFDRALGIGSRGRGGDDLAAFHDVLSAGYALTYDPGAVVRHRHRRDLADVRAQASNYGVGLTAYLTHVAARRPVALWDFVRLAPRGLLVLRGGGTGATGAVPREIARELSRRQLFGAARGPFAYARSVASTGRARG